MSDDDTGETLDFDMRPPDGKDGPDFGNAPVVGNVVRVF